MTNTFDILLKDNTISLEKRKISTSSILKIEHSYKKMAYFRHLHEQTQLKKLLLLNKNKLNAKTNTNTKAKKQAIFVQANTNINTNTDTERNTLILKRKEEKALRVLRVLRVLLMKSCLEEELLSLAAVTKRTQTQLTTLKDSSKNCFRTKTVNVFHEVLHTPFVTKIHKERRQVFSTRYFSQFVSYFHKKAHVQVSSHMDSIACMRDLRLQSSQKYCLQKLVNICMVHGKKSKACSIITNTLYKLAHFTQTQRESVDVMAYVTTAIDNVKPILEVKKVRISGSTQLVPSIISKRRQDTLAIRWILEAATKRRSAKRNLTLDQCVFAEIVDAFNKVGTVRKKRDELHKLAEANRGFSHYRWW